MNEDYFSSIDREDQAYWLGFITADGGIIRNDRSYSVKLDLAIKDVSHLEHMKNCLGSNIPIKFRDETACIAFHSWKMVEDLGKLGVTPKKSATVRPWNGPDHLMPHYWRGLFDGDGSIFQGRRDGTWTLSQYGSEFCVTEFSMWAKNICGSKAYPRRLRGDCWSWTVEGGPRPQKLAEALYRNSTVHLQRKKESADGLISIDFVAARALSEKKRAAAIKESWESGRHARSKVLNLRGGDA